MNLQTDYPSRLQAVMDNAQSGLLYFPQAGLFLNIKLKNLSEKAKARTWDTIQALEAESEQLTKRGQTSNYIVAFNPKVWKEWTGEAPSGGPSESSVLNASPYLKNTCGKDHLWFYLKADTEANCRLLANIIKKYLNAEIEEIKEQPAGQREDGKILDHHFNDGITSPSDPTGIVGPILRDKSLAEAGSSWVFTQDFQINWSAYGSMSYDAKDDVIGRDGNGSIIPDDNPHSHIRRARVFDDNQDNIKLLRQALPYGTSDTGKARENGIYFVAFASGTENLESILKNMLGHGHGPAPDKLFSIVEAKSGGYWYVPGRRALGLKKGLELSDFQPADFWKKRSDNGYMFYNGNDYVNIMSTGQYKAGDPPSDRILNLVSNIFSRWRDNWYRLRDIPKIPHLKNFLDKSEMGVLEESVVVRKGIAIKKTLTKVHTHANPSYPVNPESYGAKADTFRIHPMDLLYGVMPELSLARGKEVMPYLQEGDERLNSLLMGISEGGMVGHVVPDHPAVLSKGLGKLLKETEQLMQEHKKDNAKFEFYQSVKHALEGVQGLILNFAALAEKMAAETADEKPWEKENLLALAKRARKLSTKKPETFAEGVQMVLTMHSCLHLIGNPVSIGRLDQYLGDLYENDPDITEAEAQELIDALWVKLDEKAIHNRHYITDHLGYGMTAVPYSGGNFSQGSAINQWIQQVTVGGVKRDGSSGCNAVTLLCIKASRRLPLNAPCLSLRVFPEMPEEVFAESAKALLSGGAHPILFQENHMVKGLNEFSNFPIEDARDYACDGCYEPLINGKTEFAFGSVKPLDALEMAMNQGATLSGAGIINLRGLKQGYRTPHATDIQSFEELQELMKQHLYTLIVQLFNGILSNYGNIGKVSPGPLLSVMMDGCMEKGRDIYSGGARYHLIAPMFIGMSVAIDSLYAIKKLVFDDGSAVMSLHELLECLYSDWGNNFTEPFQSVLAGKERADQKKKWYGEVRQMALNLPKFGTGHKEVDEIGAWLSDCVSRTAREVMDNPPGFFKDTLDRIKKDFDVEMHMCPGIGTFEEYVGAGQGSAASADGRLSGQPFPSDFSPTPVPQDLDAIPQDEHGVQPRPYSYRDIYQSMKSWDNPAIYHQITNASPVDLNIKEDFPEDELVKFIKRYAAGDGVGSNLITVSCADPDTYTAAEKDPERYELVRVRMGGWTEFFAAMFPPHQEQHKRRPWFTPPE